jgi:hypothetical protein
VARFFDLDNLGAQIPEHHGAEGARQNPGKIKHTNAAKRQVGVDLIGHSCSSSIRDERPYINGGRILGNMTEQRGCGQDASRKGMHRRRQGLARVHLILGGAIE